MNQIQEKIIKIFNDHGGKLPPFRTLAKMLGVASTNTVSYHINTLKKNGYLEISKSHQGIAKLTVKSLLNLEAKPGVYVLLKNNKPFYIAHSNNIKKDLIENVIGIDRCPLSELKEKTENITIAYHIIENQSDQEELQNYLKELYKLNQ